MPFSMTQALLDQQQQAASPGDIAPPTNSPSQQPPQPENLGEEDVGTYIARRAIPFYSAIRNFGETQDYTAAKNRLTAGNSRTPRADAQTVAQYELQQRRDESRGLGGQILSGLASVPALIGETAAGGAVLGRLPAAFSAGTSLLARGGRIAATTALSPAFYLQQSAQRAQENGGQWYEPQNLGVAGAMGIAQMAVLEALPNFSRGITGNTGRAIAARLGISTATGMGGQQIVDALGGAVDEILPQAYQTRTRYGVLGDAMRGEWGHAWQHAAVQATTFAAFSAMHARGAEATPEPPMDPSKIPEASREFPTPSSKTPVDVPQVQLPAPGRTPSSAAPASEFAPMPLNRGTGIIEAFARAANEKTLANREKVGETLSRVTKTIQEVLASKGQLTPEEAKAVIDGLKVSGEVKAYAEKLIEAGTQTGVPGRPVKSDREVLGRERPKPGEIPADLLSRSRPPLDQLADPEPPPIPRVPDPRDVVGAAVFREKGHGPDRPNTVGVRGNVPLRPGVPVYGPELPPGGVRAPFTRNVTSSPPLHPLPGDREAARGSRAGSTTVPIPPEMLTRVAPPSPREASSTPRPGFHPDKGTHFSPKDEVAAAMLAKRMPIREAPAAPPPRLEPQKAPTVATESPKAATGQLKRSPKPKEVTPPPRDVVEEALARHISGDPTGMADAAKMGGLTPEEAKALGERLKLGDRPSFDQLGKELGLSYQGAKDLETAALKKLGLKVTTAEAGKAVKAGGKQELIAASESSREAAGSGGARRTLEEHLSDHLSAEIDRATAAGMAIDPIVHHYAELAKVELRKELVDANKALIEAGAKPLTAQDHEYISKLAKGEEVAPLAAYLETRPAEPTKRGRTRLAVTGESAESRAAEPITPERIKAVADLSMHHTAVVKKVQGMILASNVPPEKKMEYMNNQLRILSEMPPTAAALHSASLRAANFHPTVEALGQSLAATSPEVRAVLKDGDQVGGAYNRSTGTMTLDGGTKDASGTRLAGHETAHLLDGPREAISNSPEVMNAYLKEGLKGIIGEYARTDHHEFFAETLGLVYSGEMSPAQLKTKMPLMYEAMVSRDLIRRAEGLSRFEKPTDVFDRAINDGPTHADTLIRLRTVTEESTPEKAMEKAKALDRISGALSSKASTLGAKMWEGTKAVMDNLKQLSGKSFVQTTAISRQVGEAMGRFVASREYVNHAIPDYIDLVLGPKASDSLRHQAGAAIMELNAEHFKRNLAKQENSGDKIAAVRSFIADSANPVSNPVFKNKGEYQAFLASAEGQRVIAAYKEHFAPELHDWWRKYKTDELADSDPIIGPAQLPDMPVNWMRLEPGEAESSPYFIGGGRANLKNPQQKKLVFDQGATRAHEAYETDLAKIMANSLNKTVSTVNKKVMYEATVTAGIGERGKAGGRGTLPNGDKVWEIPKVYGNGDSHYVSERIASEMRQALAVDKPQSIPFVTEASKILNRAMGAGLAEPVAHVKNQFTALMSAGVNPLELIPNAIKVINGDVGVRKQLLELAKINAARAKGLESGQLWGGKTDPSTYISKLIHVMDSATRLTLKSAYERNVRMGRTEASETGLRDFVNQGLGDYNKLSQHKLVVLLRDLGIGPFATAGTKFYTSAARLLIGDPGLTATTNTQAVLMRAEILGKLVVAVSAVALANKALWKHVLGDDDTPLGAIKTGKTEDGKTTYLDLMAFTGLTRGMRQTGLLALGEGLRQGSSPQRIADRATEAIYTSMMHPMEGPVVNFAHTLVSGRDTFGRNVVPPESAGGSRAVESARAAVVQANPFTAEFLGHDKRHEDMTFGQRTLGLLGPFNPFKQRGDQVLGEMHGRLRELEDQRRAFFTSPENTSRPFSREAEYRVLKRFDEAVGKLNDAITGTASTPQGRRMIARPETARIRELRQQVTDLAQQAIQRQREYRLAGER